MKSPTWNLPPTLKRPLWKGELLSYLLSIVLMLIIPACLRKEESFRFEKVREIPLRLSHGEVICDVSDLLTDEDKRIYIADRKCHSIWVFNETGSRVLRIGGKGKGPGELDGPVSIALFGDTLIVLEAGNQRVSFFSRNGMFLYSFLLKLKGPPSGIEIGPNKTIIVSESLGLQHFAFFRISGETIDVKALPPEHLLAYVPVQLAGGHMSLSKDGHILYSFIREYKVIKLDWHGRTITEFRANPSQYVAPDLKSMEVNPRQTTWCVVGLPLQVNDFILVQWFKRQAHPQNPSTAMVDRFADLFTADGKPVQLDISIPNTFLHVRDGLLYGMSFQSIERAGGNPSVVVYSLLPAQSD